MPQIYFEILTPCVIVLGTRALGEVMIGHEGGTLINVITALIKVPRGLSYHFFLCHLRTREVSHLQSGTGLSPEASHAGTLISSLWNCEKYIFVI